MEPFHKNGVLIPFFFFFLVKNIYMYLFIHLFIYLA